ncbi:sensor histidine kinase [Streptomyces sp. ST2-7A]|uniref:sensor histidine kinase n=1 Tax=Streptomyces sp. ST2-7A TaxID=2907214 RepID=UPI001F2DD163|nr:histidine kinase [Streptomyces sp. ST2-7A]MCE7082361.1 histidine kinase [Streptomyces sp. ST2-7A]
MAASITTVVILCFLGVALAYALNGGFSAIELTICVFLMLLLLFLQFCHSFPSWFPRISAHPRSTLTVQTVLTFAPFAAFGATWLGMPGFLASSCLLLLRPGIAWFTFALVIAMTGAMQFIVGYGVEKLGYNTVATCLTGLVVYGLSRLTSLVSEVQTARDELVRMALAQERIRFARDLHDLLGFSLSTIALKSELAHRLVSRDPVRAEAEITEIVRDARQALTEVRSVAGSYLQMSLERELRAASSLLRAVGIHAEMRIEVGTLTRDTDSTLAIVLREGVTNVLRHSKAQKCRIEATTNERGVRLTIANDGLRDADAAHFAELGAARRDPGTGSVTTVNTNPAGTAGGNGLSNIAARARALGGELQASERPDGWYELTVLLPAAGKD